MADAATIRTYLAAQDPILGQALHALPAPITWREDDVYLALLRAIIFQQLSTTVADAIYGRFRALFRDDYPSPAEVIAMPTERLREAGLSGRKAEYVKAIADYAQHTGLDADHLRQLPAEDVVAQLTTIRGVGRWTVEMLLMFTLGHPDTFSPGDVGLQTAMRDLYDLDDLKGRALQTRLESIAAAWAPYRTTACLYLWAHKRTL